MTTREVDVCRPSRPSATQLSVVVPSYQSGDRLTAFLPRLIDALDASERSWEIIVVDDGSTDGSTDGIDEFGVRTIRLEHNHGKGAALRTGFAAATGALVGFIDADGQYDPLSLATMATLCDRGWDLAIGQRFDMSADRHYSRSRSLGSRAMSYLVHLLIDPSLSESQAGIKVMRRDVLDAVLPHLQCDGFAIDVELMAWSKRLGFRRHAVQPVSFQHDGNSTVTLRRSMAVVGELVRLRMRFASSDVRRTTYRRGVRAERHVHELAAHAHRLAAIDTPIADAAAELAERAGSQRRIDAARDIVRTQRSRRNDGSREHIDQLLAAARATLPTSRWHTLVDSFTGPERVHGPRPAGQVR